MRNNLINQTITLSFLGEHTDFEVQQEGEGRILIVAQEPPYKLVIKGTAKNMDRLCEALEIALAERRKNLSNDRIETAQQQLITINAITQNLSRLADRLPEFGPEVKLLCNSILRHTTIKEPGGK